MSKAVYRADLAGIPVTLTLVGLIATAVLTSTCSCFVRECCDGLMTHFMAVSWLCVCVYVRAGSIVGGAQRCSPAAAASCWYASSSASTLSESCAAANSDSQRKRSVELLFRSLNWFTQMVAYRLVISAHLPTEQLHTWAYHFRRQKFCCHRTAYMCETVYRQITSYIPTV